MPHPVDDHAGSLIAAALCRGPCRARRRPIRAPGSRSPPSIRLLTEAADQDEDEDDPDRPGPHVEGRPAKTPHAGGAGNEAPVTAAAGRISSGESAASHQRGANANRPMLASRLRSRPAAAEPGRPAG
jgi:hypothetical protein